VTRRTQVTCTRNQPIWPRVEPVRTDRQYPLREASRQLRIAALRHFSELLRGLTQEAEQAVKAIKDAKRFAELCEVSRRFVCHPPKPLYSRWQGWPRR
jgi:hypothetical protein